MAFSPLRFGLELEMHGITLTFRRRDNGDFWAPAANGQQQEDTMIAVEPILVPLQPGNGFVDPVTQRIIWESNWGFRAVGDAHGLMTVRPQGQNAREAGCCLIELATAARPVDDHDYVVPTMIQDNGFRWYPLQSFLNDYNTNIANMVAAPDTFKLAKSQAIQDFENGNHAGFIGQNWDAYITCTAGNQDINKWCDVQVNYQFNVRSLYSDTEAWINTWNSIWAQRTESGDLDPPVGDTGRAPFSEMYRNQAYAAMWRLAKDKVDQIASPLSTPANVGPQSALAKALIMYVLVTGSVTNVAEGNASSKNAYPQLPKTSPASIARQIETLQPNTITFFTRLAQPPPPPPRVEPRLPVEEAQAFSLEYLRNKARLMLDPGNLPQWRPKSDQDPFTNKDGGILSPPVPANFQGTWLGAFNNANPLNAGNDMGFTTLAPFFVRWAADVNFTYPAVRFNAGGGPPGPNDEIKMLFESRYGRSMMNLGFNPYIDDFMFNRSYKRMVRLLAGPQALSGALLAAVDADFPNNPSKIQNFSSGPH
ncbi:MAG: hypothetical protein Q9227_004815 [Pyrenula ochraceoflavens]